MVNLGRNEGVVHMRIEDVYFEETVKINKANKGTSQGTVNKGWFRNSKVISNMLNRMHTCIPFFRKE